MKIILLALLCLISDDKQNFICRQKKFARVQEAYHTKGPVVTRKLQESGLSMNNLNILIVAYKQESLMDIYAKKREDSTYKKLITYRICAKSGHLGPKRQQGDGQVPEGFYYINHFNPNSNYHLSLMINYPNASDKIKSQAPDPGGNICIHGNCVTIGCLPMTNDKIKEIYIYAVQAYQSGQEKIPVYIFPFKFSPENTRKYREMYKTDPHLLLFWENLKIGYDLFINTLKEPGITVDKLGNYQFSI